MTTETASPALLKDILGPQALQTIADAGTAASPQFDRATFLRAASDGLDALSIMERVRHIADALHSALPGGYARKSQPTLSTDLRQRLAQKAGFEQAQAAFKCLETACNLRKGLQLLAEMPP